MLNNPVLESRKIWKGYVDANGAYRWILKGLNLKFLEGKFISILGKPEEGKSTLLKTLGFLEIPEKGEIYFQGRLVGKKSNEELEHMLNERVWLIDLSAPINPLVSTPKTLAVVLLDDPAALYKISTDPTNGYRLLTRIYNLNCRGVTVVVATKNPKVASLANSIHILSRGELKELTYHN